MGNFGFNQAFSWTSYGFGNGFSYGGTTKKPLGPVLFFDADNSASYPGYGTTWTDLVGGVQATLAGTYAYHSGRINFNSNGKALTPNNVTVSLTDGFTMEVFVKFNDLSSGEQGIFVFNDPGYMNLIYDGGEEKIRWEVDAGQSIFDGSGDPIVIGKWYHFVGTWDRASGIASLYRDGVLVASAPKTCNETSRTSYVQIGVYDADNYPYGAYTNGDIAVVRMYDRSIKQTEVVNNYNDLASRYSGPMLYLDSGNATSYSGTGATWYDISGYGNDATLLNSPMYSSNNNGTISFVSSNKQAATVPDMGDLNRWTVESWVKFNDLTNIAATAIVANQYNGVSNVNFALGDNTSGALSAGFFASGWYNTPPSLTPDLDKWYHLVGTYDGGTITLYVNGVSTSTQSAVVRLRSGGNVNIARRWDLWNNTTSYLDATIPIVKIYDRALSSAEVLNSYNDTKVRYPNSAEVVQDHLELWFDSRYPASYPGTGTSWTDMKNGVVATLQSGVSFNSETKTMTFNGTSSAHADTGVYVTDMHSGYTLEAYVSWNVLQSYDGVIAYNESPNYTNLEYIFGGVRFEGSQAQIKDEFSPVLGTFYHYVCTWDGVNSRIYRDGVLVAGPTFAGNPQSTTHAAPWVMGHWDGYLNGAITMTRLYSKALSDAEVLQNYNATLHPNVPSILVPDPYFKWDPANYNAGDQTIPDTGTYPYDNKIHLQNGASVSGSPPRMNFGGDGSSQWGYTVAASSPGPFTFTIGAWVKTPWTARKILGFEGNQVGEGSGLFDRHMFVQDSTGLLGFGVYDTQNETLLSTTPVNDNSWHHCVATCTFDPNTQAEGTGTVKLYVDGVLEATKTASPLNYGGYWRVGSYGGWPPYFYSGYYNGSLGLTKIWNEALSDAQVAGEFNNTRTTYGV